MPTRMTLLAAGLAIALGAMPGARAQATYDGTYRGEPVSGTGCTTFSPTLRVSNGVATMRYNTQVSFEGKVEADGAVQIFAGSSALSGKIAGGHFLGQVASGRCRYTLDLAK